MRIYIILHLYVMHRMIFDNLANIITYIIINVASHIII